MVRRVNHLFESVTGFDNLWYAWKKARQGSGWGPETHQFFYYLEKELLQLQQELQEERYQPGPYRHFHIKEPKPRCIAVAPFRDRVVHHALVQVLTPVFEPTFISDSYATRVNKGTHKAIMRAQSFCRRYDWYYKMDISAFFETVDHGVMLKRVSHKIKDQRVHQLTATIIHNVEGGKGLPIGNLTSQFFANVYLNPLDWFIKQNLGAKGYLRYMDDFVIFSDDKDQLKTWHAQIAQFVTSELRLNLKQKANWLNTTQHGLSFLGRRIFPGLLRHCPENYRRSLLKAQKRLRDFEHERIDEQTMADSLACISAHLNHFR